MKRKSRAKRAVPGVPPKKPEQGISKLKQREAMMRIYQMVGKILRSEMIQGMAMSLWQEELVITAETTEQISTSLWISPMGAPQLLGMGIRASITGKHA